MPNRLARLVDFALREQVFLCLVMVVAAYLGFKGLGYNYLWDDEASNGILARNYNTTGITGIGTKSVFTFRDGASLNEKFEIRNPPIENWVTACSFKIFGTNTLAARFPFVLLGLGSLILLWFVLRHDFPDFRNLRYYAFVLTAFSYSFLLNIRQCRYYSLALFFGMATWLSYRKVVSTGKVAWGVALAASAALLYLSHYLAAGALLLSIATIHLIFGFKATPKRLWLILGGAALAFVIAVLPNTIAMKPWYRPDIPAKGAGLATRPLLLLLHLRDVDRINYLPGLLVIPGIFFLIRYRKKAFSPSLMVQYFTFAGIFVVFASFFSPQPIKWVGMRSMLTDVRYLVPLIPMASVLVAYVLHLIHRGAGGLISTVVLATVLSTNVLSLNLPGESMRFLLPGFLYEIHKDYTTPYEAAVEYMLANGKEDEVVYGAPGQANLSLDFYLGHKFRIGGDLRKAPTLPMDRLRALDLPLFIDEYFPDWFISFGLDDQNKAEFEHFSRDRYQYRFVTQLPVFFKDMTRPELPLHRFSETKPASPQQMINVFRREPKPVAPGRPSAADTSAAVKP